MPSTRMPSAASSAAIVPHRNSRIGGSAVNHSMPYHNLKGQLSFSWILIQYSHIAALIKGIRACKVLMVLELHALRCSPIIDGSG